VSQAKRLYELQAVDHEIEVKENALRGVEAGLGQRDALERVQALIQAQQQALDDLKRRLHHQEWELEDLTTKIAALEERLYSGRITNPKELSSLQHEVELLKAQRSRTEDRALELMAAVDKAKEGLAARHQELDRAEKQWQAEQAQLRSQQAQLREALAALRQSRHSLGQQVDSAHLTLYETLKAKKQGQAVARVEQGMCRGCRISLPTHLLQEARQRVAQCTSCHRILYLD